MMGEHASKNILEYSIPEYLKKRIKTDISFIDTILDGGFVPSTTALLSGEPGAGKTTLMMQISDALTRLGNIVLYNSVEQTADQIVNLAHSLGLKSGFLFEKHQTFSDVTNHLLNLQKINSDKNLFLVLDSVSAFANNSRAEATRLIKAFTNFCQETKVIGLFVVHQTKGGEFAGNNTMLHDVDAYYRMSVANPMD